MTGAMYAAVSGMRAHMNKLNVISNNVANVNTYGYKAGSVTFAEALYTTTSSGADGTAISGGVNPAQIGYGASISTIDLDMSSKNFIPTGSNLDCMISGDGFFMVGDKSGVTDPSQLMMSRVGKFRFDEDGYLVDGAGQVVYGFVTCSAEANGGVIDPNDPDTKYQGPDGQTLGVSTALAPIRLPIAAKASADQTTAGALKGGEAVYSYVGADGMTHDADDADVVNAEGKCVSLDGVSIDKNGKITGTNRAGGETVIVGYVPLATVPNPSGVTHMGGPYYKALGGAGEIQVAAVGGVVAGNLGNKAAADATAREQILGSGGTELAPGGVESSGTDVATEFSEMITTQRGYQANTRVITVTDTMLEELVNIKR